MYNLIQKLEMICFYKISQWETRNVHKQSNTVKLTLAGVPAVDNVVFPNSEKKASFCRLLIAGNIEIFFSKIRINRAGKRDKKKNRLD